MHPGWQAKRRPSIWVQAYRTSPSGHVDWRFMVPFLDLRAQYEGLRDEIHTAITGVLESSQFVLGQYVADFEREFAAYCGVDHAIAVNSGTSALHLALLAAGVTAGDEVITVPFTFIATLATISYCNATPVLVDI